MQITTLAEMDSNMNFMAVQKSARLLCRLRHNTQLRRVKSEWLEPASRL